MQEVGENAPSRRGRTTSTSRRDVRKPRAQNSHEVAQAEEDRAARSAFEARLRLVMECLADTLTHVIVVFQNAVGLFDRRPECFRVLTI